MPSKPEKPDLDWSQVRETVRMLDLAVSRIEKTMREGDESITTLAGLFTSMMGNVQVIGRAAENLPEGHEKETLTSNFKTVSKKMGDAIVSFQFYDLMAQQLSHISFSLASLSELIADPQRLYNPYEWYGLQQMIRSKYPTESDRVMFDAILDGSSIAEALELAEKIRCGEQEKKEDGDNIELF